MISADSMKFYLDPVQDMTVSATRLYVTEEMAVRYGRELVGTIVNIKPATDRSGNRHWWVTEDGYYVQGAPIATDAQHYVPYVGLVEDGVFVVGEMYGLQEGLAVLQTCRRSDGAARPGRHGQYRVKSWMRAAPWAFDLMPEPGDSTDTVAAKVALAKAKHTRRTAMRVILTESMERDWNKDLDELREDHDIPKASFGAYVEGFALITIDNARQVQTADLSQHQRDRIAKLTGTTPTAVDQRLSVPIKFMAPLNLSDDSGFTAVTAGSVTAAARRKFEDRDLNLGAYSLSPVLRTLSA